MLYVPSPAMHAACRRCGYQMWFMWYDQAQRWLWCPACSYAQHPFDIKRDY